MLSQFFIAFLSKSKHLFISWLQSTSVEILEPKKMKSVTASTFSQSICHEMMGPDAMIFILWQTSIVYSQKAMAPHSSTPAWKISWMEEPERLQSMGSLGVGHNWTTSLWWIGEGNGNPLQYSCLENPRDRGAWWAAVYWVAQSRTWLKWLSSSSSSSIVY